MFFVSDVLIPVFYVFNMWDFSELFCILGHAVAVGA